MDWTDRIGRRVKLRDLHIVLSVAECGSMAKAATQLAISHPVVSKTISNLEQTLRVKLFDRTARGVELTTYGRALLKCGTTVFDEMRQGLRQIEFLADSASGELRIGASEIYMAGLLPAAIERFSHKYPAVRLHVTIANAAMLQFEALRERRVDLMIGRLPAGFAADDLVAEALFDEPFLVLADARSKWARRRTLALAELVDEPWVLPPYDTAPGAMIAQLFRDFGIAPPEPSVVTLLVQLTVNLIASGQFVGMLPASAARFSAPRVGLAILPINAPAQRTGTSIITVKGRTLVPPAALFIDCVRTMGRALSGPFRRTKTSQAATPPAAWR